MSINLNIEEYGGKSVLPVTCGSSRGTAFYIGEGRFLTAWHVVAEAEVLQEPIMVTREDETFFCQLEKLGDMDVALLNCKSDIPDITPIKLLKVDFRDDDLEIVGYPQELGNGIDYFGVCVKNLKELSDHHRGFDVMVLRTDSIGFCSYSGFSGSPVLNKKGVAVGVVTDQLFNTLGYTSISSISDSLTKKRVQLLDCADRYDLRPFGIGKCEELARQSCKKMKSRYTRKNHIEDEDIETLLQIFCGFEADRWEKRFREELNSWYKNASDSLKAAVDDLKSLKACMEGGVLNFETARDLDRLLNKRENDQTDKYFVAGKFRNKLIEISDLMGQSQEAENLVNERFLYVHGDAGCGKTQHMCYFTESISQHRNVYLLFGTDFEPNKNPGQSIREALGWDEENNLDALNSEMELRGRYATFIIDALNEGEGTFMWNTLLPSLKAEIDCRQRLKLIVTVRTMESGDQLNNQFVRGWEELEIKGFANLRNAIDKYFFDAGINEKAEDYLYLKEFQHPLFLKIFCQVFHRLPIDFRKDPDILLLYSLYYLSRNDEISRLVDEDPEQMITPNIMKKIGDLSWLDNHCCDIPRNDVIKIANEMCPNRLWSNNLYHALVNANLVMEYRSQTGLKTAFQYDSMGDYMRAQCMLLAYEKDKDDALLDSVIKMTDNLKDTSLGPNVRTHINHTIKAFLSVWNPPEDIWRRSEFTNGELTQLLLESLVLRNFDSQRSTLPKSIVTEIVLSKDDFINPKYLLDNFTLYRDFLMEPVHEKLMSMSLLERDERWTISVNKMYDDHSYFIKCRKSLEPNEKNARAYIWILCWLMSTSHPQLRNLTRRIVHGWLRDYSQLCKELVENFFRCNDPYILRGIYGAIYGVLLIKRDKDLTHEVAETVFKCLYESQVMVPIELEVRSWTLKILEFNHLLNPEDPYWNSATPPYRRQENLMEYPKTENYDDVSYFGEGHGAKAMHDSLFAWDFNRYIIGTNSRNESDTYIKDGKAVELDDITKAIAFRIKHVYGYSQLLSDYDGGVKWEERIHRRTERIGKKYQWIAYGEVKAYLSDTCKMKKDRWNDDPPEEIPYPWYDSESITFEPTLTISGNRSYLDQELFDEIPGEDLMVDEAHQWLESRTLVPKPCIIVKDKKAKEWVNIVGYQKKEQAVMDDNRESFIFICPCLVKKDKADDFEQWAKDQCFYGRWMPEDSGHYEFFWNEFPWSDSYKSLEFEEDLEIYRHRVAAPCKVSLPYASQLQEYYEGIDDSEEFEAVVNMPCADMFDYFNLHTAERGVTRDENDNVVALCRNLQNDSLDTMVMRRDLLNKYLEARELTLFYCMLGEKRLTMEPQQFFIQRLSCCLKYVPDGEPIVVQPMTDERDFPQPPQKRGG